ncbi:(2Fe-2S)-binding protein [Priestia koreensis]|uniref:(2Fe-2S)-binding protein n=1 Tax=Priestia koreensis TaxID=284581 RepID=UPI003CFEA932
MAMQLLKVKVNGKQYEEEVDINWTLADFLRFKLNLTGTHIGCDTVSCGACTVLLNNNSVKSCSIFAIQCQNLNILTVEGIDPNTLQPLQQAFKECFAVQCGFCTSGFLMTGTNIINNGCHLEAEEIAEELKGNLCRCTGYDPIIQAIKKVQLEKLETQNSNEEKHILEGAST